MRVTREALGDDRIGPQLKKEFGGIYIANERFDQKAAEAAIERGDADAVAFGKAFTANPDLPRRFAVNAPLNKWNAETLYSAGPEGCTDYPAVAWRLSVEVAPYPGSSAVTCSGRKNRKYALFCDTFAVSRFGRDAGARGA
jgi:hypothetical protein